MLLVSLTGNSQNLWQGLATLEGQHRQCEIVPPGGFENPPSWNPKRWLGSSLSGLLQFQLLLMQHSNQLSLAVAS